MTDPDPPPDDPPAAPVARLCEGCLGPLLADEPEDSHPCCDPVVGRTVRQWADRLHNERIRATADTVRATYRAARRT
jgi:hypothetical protein